MCGNQSIKAATSIVCDKDWITGKLGKATVLDGPESAILRDEAQKKQRHREC
jgi:hypothetical protein